MCTNRYTLISIIAFALGALLPFMPPYVAAADPVPNETLVSLQRDLLDLEYSQSRSQFAWTDSAGNLWIGNVDPVTGLFNPANGKAILIDPAAMTAADRAITTNGPEWVSTSQGDEIVYTKFLKNYTHSSATARLALAQEGTDGLWSYKYLGPNLPRMAPYGSSDEDDSTPRITYVDSTGNHYWRELYVATTEELIPLIPPSMRSVRFVQGRRAVIFATLVGGVSQVFLYDLDAKTLEKLTYDAGDKDLQSVPWMWQAPEFNNEYVFMTVVNNDELRVYRNVDVNGEFQWAPVYSAAMPAGSNPASLEPFTYNGKSYIFNVDEYRT